MKYNYLYVILFLFLLIPSFGFAQYTILCGLNKYVYIKDQINIPIVTNNGDGTITLTHNEQYITDIFAKYVIYDFVKQSGKLYSIKCKSKDLLKEIKQTVPSEILSVDDVYNVSTPLSSNLIAFLDGKKFTLKKYCGIADDIWEAYPEKNVPNDFNLMVEFNYDSINDFLVLESFGLTPCGNSFSLALKGGTLDNTLQLWECTPTTITQTTSDQPCTSIENDLFSILDIACSNGNLGDIIPTINNEDNTLFLRRDNVIFGYNTVTFEESRLSIEELVLNNLKLYQIKGNPNLQISNTQNKEFYVEIFSVSGRIVMGKTRFERVGVPMDGLGKNLYFAKVFGKNNQYKVFKFIKQ